MERKTNQSSAKIVVTTECDTTQNTQDNDVKTKHDTNDLLCNTLPHTWITLHTHELSNKLDSVNKDWIWLSHINYMLQSIRNITIFYFISIAMLLFIDTYLNLNNQDKILIPMILFHIVFIGLCIYCICYISNILKKIRNEYKEKTKDGQLVMNTQFGLYYKLRKLYWFIYALGAVICIMSAIMTYLI